MGCLIKQELLYFVLLRSNIDCIIESNPSISHHNLKHTLICGIALNDAFRSKQAYCNHFLLWSELVLAEDFVKPLCAIENQESESQLEPWRLSTDIQTKYFFADSDNMEPRGLVEKAGSWRMCKIQCSFHPPIHLDSRSLYLYQNISSTISKSTVRKFAKKTSF